MESAETGLVKTEAARLVAGEVILSAWGEEMVRRGQGADETVRKSLAQEAREVGQQRFQGLAQAHSSILEVLAVADALELYREDGYDSVMDYARSLVPPETASKKGELQKLTAAAREYGRLLRQFGEVRSGASVVARLASESARQRRGGARLSGEQYEAISRRVATGDMPRAELNLILRRRDSDRGRDREDSGPAGPDRGIADGGQENQGTGPLNSQAPPTARLYEVAASDEPSSAAEKLKSMLDVPSEPAVAEAGDVGRDVRRAVTLTHELERLLERFELRPADSWTELGEAELKELCDALEGLGDRGVTCAAVVREAIAFRRINDTGAFRVAS